MDAIFWIQYINIPIIGVLFWLYWSHHRDCTAARKAVQDQITTIRVEIAKDYVNHVAMKEIGDRLEHRLTELAQQLEANRNGWQEQFEKLRTNMERWTHEARPPG